MAVTLDAVTDGDFAVISAADSITNWAITGSMTMVSLDTTSQVEGTGCLQASVNAGVGEILFTHGTGGTGGNQTDQHLRMWIKLAQSIDTLANGGGRLRIGTTTNYGEWTVYGSERQVVVYNGWMMLVADTIRPFDATVGTPPAVNSISASGARVDWLDGNGKTLVVSDMIWMGNLLYIEGGTSGDRGTFDQIGTADRTSAYGIVRPVGGVYYANAGLAFGEINSATSYFEDSNQVLVFENLPVSGALYKIVHAANATGTNHVQFGSSSGSGTSKEGASGISIKSAGSAPFRIEAINTNINVAAYFGCSLTGPTALYDDAVRNFKFEDNSAVSFTDDTRDANNSTAGDAPAMPATQALNDATYFGHDERFYRLNVTLGTAKGGTWTGTWEYYNGSSWASLTDITDGTNNYATTGAQTVTFAIPDDWAENTVNSASRYWIRFRISSFTSSGTTPVVSVCSVAMAGDIRLEDSAVEMIGCTLTNMGSVRVRNGAFLKKTLITNSIVPVKHAAVDLGSSDPTADTVRDLTIQNCSKGILLKGTSTGTTEYNFRNIQFSGNTNDVRVDFPGAATINIYILENGDTPSIDNVNSSTVNIIQTVNVTITVKNSAGDNLSGVEVAIFQDNAARTVVLASIPTDENGEVTTSVSANLGDIIIRARQSTDTMSFLTSSSATDGVDDTTDTINNSTPHKFQNGDAVVYSRNGGSVDIGPEPGTYYVNASDIPSDATSVRLYTTAALAIAAGTPIALTASGTETHKLDPVRYVAGSATANVVTSNVEVQITMVTDGIATG